MHALRCFTLSLRNLKTRLLPNFYNNYILVAFILIINYLQTNESAILSAYRKDGHNAELNEQMCTAIRCLWADPACKQAFGRRAEFQIADSAE